MAIWYVVTNIRHAPHYSPVGGRNPYFKWVCQSPSKRKEEEEDFYFDTTRQCRHVVTVDSLPPFWSWCNRRVDRSLCRCFRLIDRINGDQTDLSVDMSYCKQEGMSELTRTVTLNPVYAHYSLSFSGAANAHALKSHSHQPCLVISVSYLNIYELQIVFSNVSCFIILYCNVMCLVMCLVSLMMNYCFIG